jgi:hypothetical protein
MVPTFQQAVQDCRRLPDLTFWVWHHRVVSLSARDDLLELPPLSSSMQGLLAVGQMWCPVPRGKPVQRKTSISPTSTVFGESRPLGFNPSMHSISCAIHRKALFVPS